MERQRLTDGDSSSPFTHSSSGTKAPLGAIGLAVGLLLGGLVLLIVGVALHHDPEAHSEPQLLVWFTLRQQQRKFRGLCFHTLTKSRLSQGLCLGQVWLCCVWAPSASSLGLTTPGLPTLPGGGKEGIRMQTSQQPDKAELQQQVTNIDKFYIVNFRPPGCSCSLQTVSDAIFGLLCTSMLAS